MLEEQESINFGIYLNSPALVKKALASGANPHRVLHTDNGLGKPEWQHALEQEISGVIGQLSNDEGSTAQTPALTLTPMMVAFAKNNTDPEIIDALLKHDAQAKQSANASQAAPNPNFNPLSTLIKLAIITENLTSLSILLQYGANLSAFKPNSIWVKRLAEILIKKAIPGKKPPELVVYKHFVLDIELNDNDTYNVWTYPTIIQDHEYFISNTKLIPDHARDIDKLFKTPFLQMLFSLEMTNPKLKAAIIILSKTEREKLNPTDLSPLITIRDDVADMIVDLSSSGILTIENLQEILKPDSVIVKILHLQPNEIFRSTCFPFKNLIAKVSYELNIRIVEKKKQEQTPLTIQEALIAQDYDGFIAAVLASAYRNEFSENTIVIPADLTIMHPKLMAAILILNRHEREKVYWQCIEKTTSPKLKTATYVLRHYKRQEVGCESAESEDLRFESHAIQNEIADLILNFSRSNILTMDDLNNFLEEDSVIGKILHGNDGSSTDATTKVKKELTRRTINSKKNSINFDFNLDKSLDNNHGYNTESNLKPFIL